MCSIPRGRGPGGKGREGRQEEEEFRTPGLFFFRFPRSDLEFALPLFPEQETAAAFPHDKGGKRF